MIRPLLPGFIRLFALGFAGALIDLQRADHAAHVVGMQLLCALWVNRLQALMQAPGAIRLLCDLPERLAHGAVCATLPQRQLIADRLEIQPRPANQQRQPSPREDVVNRAHRHFAVHGDGEQLIRLCHVDHVV